MLQAGTPDGVEGHHARGFEEMKPFVRRCHEARVPIVVGSHTWVPHAEQGGHLVHGRRPVRGPVRGPVCRPVRGPVRALLRALLRGLFRDLLRVTVELQPK